MCSYHRWQWSAGVCGQNLEDAGGGVVSTISPVTNWILTIWYLYVKRIH